MKQNTISSQQIAFLLFIFMLGSALIFIPEAYAGRDAWIATILASLSGWYVLYVIISLKNMFPDINLVQLSQLSLGKIAGNILNLLLFWTIFIVLLTFVFDLVNFLHLTYSAIPTFFLVSIIILAATYCLYKGVNTIGRLGEIFIWITIIFTILGFFLAIPLINPSNLTPVLSNWKSLIAGVFYGAEWPATEVIILAFFLPLVNDLKEKQHHIYWWYFAAVVVLALKNAQILSILGMEKTSLLRFPLYEVIRLVAFADFQRMELFFFLLWFIIGFMVIVIYYQGLLLGLTDMLVLKDYKVLILPVGLCIIVFNLYMFPSDIEFLDTAKKYLPFYSLPIHILYPTIILIAAKLRQNTIAQAVNRLKQER
jgi:spore germination protein (amino acid permease)